MRSKVGREQEGGTGTLSALPLPGFTPAGKRRGRQGIRSTEVRYGSYFLRRLHRGDGNGGSAPPSVGVGTEPAPRLGGRSAPRRRPLPKNGLAYTALQGSPQNTPHPFCRTRDRPSRSVGDILGITGRPAHQLRKPPGGSPGSKGGIGTLSLLGAHAVVLYQRLDYVPLGSLAETCCPSLGPGIYSTGSGVKLIQPGTWRGNASCRSRTASGMLGSGKNESGRPRTRNSLQHPPPHIGGPLSKGCPWSEPTRRSLLYWALEVCPHVHNAVLHLTQVHHASGGPRPRKQPRLCYRPRHVLDGLISLSEQPLADDLLGPGRHRMGHVASRKPRMPDARIGG